MQDPRCKQKYLDEMINAWMDNGQAKELMKLINIYKREIVDTSAE